ncbi:hypothetical protein QFW77_03535 [Luteimonas sp. RD2P54]|uniref:DUF2884 family protein n=1 Tax=Luteimonas endophytica TaxID=3042023 RepID=A0ABT6J5I2_9GAMM|nr:hypothetical protein [Luteimonas endophytica]MDH5822066.1 hypothetical protein [Luteimonas endophytica]
MNLRLRTAVLPLAAAAALAATGAAAAADPAQCSRIVDVELPAEVHLGDARIDFTGAGVDTSIDAEALVLDGRRVAHGDPGYYEDLRRFLGEADRTAREVKPMAAIFRGRGAEVAEAATRMCGAILALAESSARVEAAVPGFVSPVRIRLE